MNSATPSQSDVYKKNERPMFGSFVFWCLGAVLVGIDQWLKYFAFSGKLARLLPQAGSFFREFNFKNFYFAFSIPLPAWLIFFIYGIALYAIFFHLKKRFSLMPQKDKLAWAFIVAGALSNIGERVILGYVRDFIYIATGIFNLADGYIIIGIIILLFSHKKVLH